MVRGIERGEARPTDDRTYGGPSDQERASWADLHRQMLTCADLLEG